MGVTEGFCCSGQRPFESNMYLTSDILWKHLEATCVIFQSFGHEEKCAHVVDTYQPVENGRRARLTAAFATKEAAVWISLEIKAYSQNPVLLPMMESLNKELVFAHVKQQIRYWFITFHDSSMLNSQVGFVTGLSKSNIWPARFNITEGQITFFGSVIWPMKQFK